MGAETPVSLHVKRVIVPARYVLTAVIMKSYNFWDIFPCSLLRVNRRFLGTPMITDCSMLVSCTAYSSNLKT